MIARLTGNLLEVKAPFILLDVGGVGYEIEAPLSTIFNLPPVSEKLTLHTSLIVRDDAHLLFGFGTITEKKLFQTLIKINGVGAKMALTILSGMDTAEFSLCIHDKDVARLVKLPGVGKKTAERLIVEMQDKLENLVVSTNLSKAPVGARGITEEAIEALLALGYKAQDARARVNKIDIDGKSLEEIIRTALKD